MIFYWWSNTVGRSGNISFGASLLPDRIDGYLEVTLHVDGKPLVAEKVRLVRAVLAAAGQQPYQPVVAVDYETRGILIEGMPLLAFGYFTSGTVLTPLQPAIDESKHTTSNGAFPLPLPTT